MLNTQRLFLVLSLFAVVLCAPLNLKRMTSEWNDVSYQKKRYTSIDLGLKPKSLTVSGFSNGGNMASNFMAMFAQNMNGAAIFAGGGPCAQGYQGCDFAAIEKQQTAENERQLKANLSNNTEYKSDNFTQESLEGKTILVFHGSQDDVTDLNTVTQTAQFFEQADAEVERLFIDDFHHVMPNSLEPDSKWNPSTSCGLAPLNDRSHSNCGYNLAKKALTTLLGYDQELMMNPRERSYHHAHGTLYEVDQRPFNQEQSNMSDYGYIYIPDDCLVLQCNFHVHFHDCARSAVQVQDTYVRGTGFSEIAATNRVIVLFPQNNDTNHNYCWASAQQNFSHHPQVESIVKLSEAIFNMNVFRKGIPEEALDFDTETDGPLEDFKSAFDGDFSFLNFKKFLNF